MVAFLGTGGSIVAASGTSETFRFQPLFGQDLIASFDPIPSP
jgi:hypothetical protein